MSKMSLWGTAVLVGAAMLLTPETSEAQRRGRWMRGYVVDAQQPYYYQSNYPVDQAAMQQSDPNAAGFTVRVPNPNAEIWFDNYKTQQRGTLRQFTTGSLNPNQDYPFHIRARWTQNGRQVEQTRDVTARAGQQMTVDFSNQNSPGQRNGNQAPRQENPDQDR